MRPVQLQLAAWGAVSVLLGAGHAAADTWTNAMGTSSWPIGQNWADGTVPNSSDPVLFPAPGPASPLVSVASGASVQSLQFDNNYQLDGGTISLANHQVTVAAGKTATINSMVVTNDFEKHGDGTLVLGHASNQLNGYLYILDGAVRVSSDGALGGSNSGIRLTGNLEAAGTFSTNKPIYLYGGAVNVLANQTLTYTGTSLWDTVFSPNYSTFIKDGAGTLVFTNHNSRSGPTMINAGTVRIEQNAQPGYGMITVGNGATLEVVNKFMSNVTIASGSTLRATGLTNTIGAAFAVDTSGMPGTGPTALPINATVATLAASDQFNVTFSGTATASSLITISGPGTVTPYGPGYLGTYRINGGVMRAQTQLGATSPSAGPIEVNSGGALGLAGSPLNRAIIVNDGGAIRHLVGSGMTMPAATIAAGANVTFAVDNSFATMQLSGQLTGGAGSTINIGGAGAVISGPSIPYAGGWSVNSGTLRVQTGNPGLGTGTSPIGINGGTLELTSGGFTRDIALNAGALRSFNNVTYPGKLTIGAGANVSLGGPLTLGDEPNDLTGGDPNTYVHINGSQSGFRVMLTQPSDFVGHWMIDGGGLDVLADDNFGAAFNTITVNMFGNLRTLGSVVSGRNINAQGGTLDTFSNHSGFQNVSGTGLTKIGGGTLEVNHVRTSSLNVNAGTVQTRKLGSTSKVDTLTIGAGGTLDLMDRALVVTTTGIGSWNGSAYTGVTGMVAKGYNGGTWDGVGGIVTSELDALTGLTALAVVPASAAALADPSQFRGVSIAGSNVLVGYTWGGDADLNGELNGDDYFAIDSNIVNSGSVFGYHNGDFNYDGLINGDDYFILDSNITFAQNSAPFPTALGGGGMSVVPEPACCAIFLLASVPLRRRRRLTA